MVMFSQLNRMLHTTKWRCVFMSWKKVMEIHSSVNDRQVKQNTFFWKTSSLKFIAHNNNLWNSASCGYGVITLWYNGSSLQLVVSLLAGTSVTRMDCMWIQMYPAHTAEGAPLVSGSHTQCNNHFTKHKNKNVTLSIVSCNNRR